MNLRETGSQIVIEAVEDAIRQGGLALLGEGFQIDSSLSYVTEGSTDGTVKGEIDLAIPFWNKNGHVIFTQGGFVFWEGLAEEERIDGNLGLAYRANLAKTPIGIDAIGGASLFYDYDFHRVGHERLGIGADIQTGNFHGAFNYYHPLSNEEDGREGFLEEALKGADLRIALERSVVRAGARVGLWRFDGGEDVADEWRTSVGVEGGVRIAPGVFIEGEWEKHQEDVILDQRLILGVAFRFSLPDFEGQSYRDGSMSTDLYKIVDREKRILYEEREKRILYEERESGPRVHLSSSVSETDDNMINVTVRLSEVLEENVVLNFIGSGSATYGTTGDWTMSVGGTACGTVTGTNCQITITAGETVAGNDVVIAFQDPVRGEPAEEITLSMEIASAGDTGLKPGNPLVVRIDAGELLPAASLVINGSIDVLPINEDADMELILSEVLSEDVTVNLLPSGTSDYGIDGHWHIQYRVPDETELSTAFKLCGDPCEIPFAAGLTRADVRIASNANPGATGGFYIEIPPAAQNLLRVGSPSRLDFTIGAAPPVVFISATSTSIAEGGSATLTATLTEAVSEDVVINLLEGGAADYGTGMDWHLNNGSDCSTATGTSCQITITAGQTSATATVNVNEDSTFEDSEEKFTVEINIASAGMTGVTAGSPSSLEFSIPAELPNTLGFATTSITADETDDRISLRGVVKDADGMKLPRITVDLPVTYSITNNQNNDITIDTAPGTVTSFLNPHFNSDREFTLRVISIVDDAVKEGEEIFVVTLGAGPNFPRGWIIDPNANTVTITINAND